MASSSSGPGGGPGGARRTAIPRRPYLLRAMHEWISDSGYTPHVIVDALQAGVEVPVAYVKEGKIVLNLSTTATQRLQLKNEGVQFDARFAGIVHHVRVPIESILGIYARETGEGMVFSESDPDGPSPPSDPAPDPDPGPETPPPETPEGRRARFTVVK